MISEHSLDSSSEFIEAELSPDEKRILQLLEGMKSDVIWVNRTQKGIVPGTLDVLKKHYSDLESFHILESLVRKGMLDRVDNGILLLCPGCGSHASSILKTCPSCGSIKLRERRKIVHAPCEHWGTFDEFKGGNTLTCPICNDVIESDKIIDNDKGFSYSDPYYECQECKFSANRVKSLFLCTSCKTKFQESNAVQLEQTGFRVAVEPVQSQEEPEIASPEATSTSEKVIESDEPAAPSKKKRSLRLLDELEKMKKDRAESKETSKEKTEAVEETSPEPETSPEIEQDEVELIVLDPKNELEREPEITPEPMEEVKISETHSEPITEVEVIVVEETPVESVEKETHESITEVKQVVEEAPVEPVEEEILEPKIEIDPEVIEEIPVEPEKEEIPEPISVVEVEPEIIEEVPVEPMEDPLPEIEPDEVIAEEQVIEESEEEIPEIEEIIEEESTEDEITKDLPEIEDVIEEKLVEEQLIENIPDIEEDFEEEPVEEEPEEDSSKVLFVVENQMVCNFVLEGLQESGVKMELNLIENGSQALKALRRVYDMIIIDSELDSIDPNFVIDEMRKWKVKSPLVIIDEGTLGDIPKELNVIAVLKQKQRDLRKIKKLITKHL